MKTLVKIAKGRTSIPVLNMVLVNDNEITATDLDTWISDKLPENIEPGLYHAAGIDKGVVLPGGVPVSDFPEMFNLGAELGHVNVYRAFMDELAWVGLAQSTEETRYYLNGICFHENHAIATDGYRLNRVSIASPWPVNPRFHRGMILPRNAFKFVMDMVKEKKPEGVTIRFFENGFQFDIGSARVVSKLMDVTFPDYERFIPTGHKKTTPFNPAEFVPIMKEMKKYRKVYGSRRDKLSLGLHRGKAYPTNPEHEKEWAELSFAPKIEIGFNVEYLTEACAGSAHYVDNSSPMVIHGDNRLAVIMPMRL